MPWPCFLVEPTPFARLGLRRYAAQEIACAGVPQHPKFIRVCNADVPYIARATILPDHVTRDWPEGKIDHSDPRWPTKCSACGKPFAETDNWQVSREDIWRAADGREFELRTAPAGCMWNAPWMGFKDHPTPDGMQLFVRLPDGADWFIDGPSSSGAFWTRTGTAPNITAHPSIVGPRYHGFLQNGVLTDDLEGRKYG